ncbi:TRAP transporter small permease [Ornithinimicrobium cavernae]|uniref:TRAP transporter small permease n=1 Tax=Ornithinimicrobium cavernae TaxID=2666047 RepID=UPI000D693EBB|nr:TRAP transporter small permease [Ornithinimicrobium cavernae]
MDRALSAVENGLTALAFATITSVAFLNVVTRYFLDASLAFTTEVTINVAVWLTMLGAVIGIREGSHLGFSLLQEKLRGRAQQVLTVLIGVAIILFFLILARYGWDQVASQLQSGRATPAMRMPQWVFTLALPVGSVLGILRTVQVTVRGLRGQSTGEGLTQGQAIA